MEKVIATVRFWYSTDIEIEVESLENEDEIQDKLADLASEFKVWNGVYSWNESFDDYEIEF